MQNRRNGVASTIVATLLALSVHIPTAQAQGVAETENQVAPGTDAVPAAEVTALSDEQLAALKTIRDKIESDDQSIRFLRARLEETEGLIADVTHVRLDTILQDRYDSLLKLSRALAGHAKKGHDVSEYMAWVQVELPALPSAVFGALDGVVGRMTYPDERLSTIDLIAADQQLFAVIADVDNAYALLIDYLAVANTLGVSVVDQVDEIVNRLSESAADRSAFLDISIRTAANIRAGLAIVPGNEDLLGRQRAADARVRLIANSLQRVAGYMATLDLDVSRYRQQVLTATGEISTAVLDVGIVASLVAEWSVMLKDVAIDQGPKRILQLLLLALIIFVSLRASRLVEKLVNRALDTSKVQVSYLLRRMLVNTGRNLTVLLGILIALSQIGISLGPLLAGLGIAGFIIGFAMQDSLSNFASGMLILFYRPFDVGDTVEAGGVFGKVQSMSLVNTTFMTFDNQTLVVPNNMIWQSPIKNVTAQRTRRVDLTFGIAYGADLEKAERVFRDACAAHDKVLQEPEPMIHLHELADSSVNFIVRPWVETDDYWTVYWDLMRDIKLGLDEAGISIPFPQRDIHIIDHQPA